MKQSVFPAQEIADRMRRSKADPRHGVVTEAFFFIEAIRKSVPVMPSVNQVPELLAALDTHPALLIDLLEVAELHGIGPLSAKPGDGAILFFSDFSACWFNEQGQMDEVSADFDAPAAIFGEDFPAGMSCDVIAASPAFVSAHGEPEPFYSGTNDDVVTFIEEALLKLMDLIDPPVDGAGDLDDVRNWTDQDIARLQEAIEDVWLGLQPDFEVTTVVYSSVDTQPEEVTLAAGNLDSRKTPYLDAFTPCLTALIDLSQFSGWEYIGNDEPHDRLSGYDKDPIEVLSLDYAPDDPSISNHRRIAGPAHLRARLAAAGKTSEDIDRLLQDVSCRQKVAV